MKRTALALEGAWLIEPAPSSDERGEFARTYCEATFDSWGLATRFVQASISFNRLRGTLRGMHFQTAPHGEIKLIRCTRGAIFDVIIDLRPGSPTQGRWHGETLDETHRTAVYVPEGFAHGFMTLADSSEVLYEMSAPYSPSAASGVRWDDPAFGVEWPFAPILISARDRAYPDLST